MSSCPFPSSHCKGTTFFVTYKTTFLSNIFKNVMKNNNYFITYKKKLSRNNKNQKNADLSNFAVSFL